MNIENVKIYDLMEDINNSRKHNRRNLDAIKESLLKFKQYAPIIVQKKTNKIIAGNGTYVVAKELGWDEIECVFIDVDDETAKAMAIMDNRSAELAAWDNTVLLKFLSGLEEDDLKVTGFVEQEVKKLMEKLDMGENEKRSLSSSRKHVCPRCGKSFNLNQGAGNE